MKKAFEKIFKKVSDITVWNIETQTTEEVKKFENMEFHDEYVTLKAGKCKVKVFYDMLTVIRKRYGYKIESNIISMKSHTKEIKELKSIVEEEEED